VYYTYTYVLHVLARHAHARFLCRPRKSRRRGESALDLALPEAAPQPDPRPPSSPVVEPQLPPLAAAAQAAPPLQVAHQKNEQPAVTTHPTQLPVQRQLVSTAPIFSLSVAGMPSLPFVFLGPPPPLLKAMFLASGAPGGGLPAVLFSHDAAPVPFAMPDVAMASIGHAAMAG